MKKQSKINKVFCSILMILLIVEILAIFIINLASNTILKKSYMEEQLEKTEFYAQMKDNIETTFKNYVLQANLDDTFVEDLMTEEKIKSDIGQILDEVYDGKEMTIETDSIKENLQQRIDEKLLGTKKALLTQEAKKQIDDFIDVIIENYKSTIEISEPTIKQAGAIVQKANNLISKYSNLLYITFGITIALLSILYSSGRRVGIFNIYEAIAIMSSGLMLIITYVISRIKIDVDNILIYNKAVTNLIIDLIKNIQSDFIKYGIILFAIGLIIAIIENIITKAKEKSVN